MDDGDMEDVEEADSAEEDSAETPSREESKSSGFVVVGSEEPSQSSFSIIDTKAKDSALDSSNKTESFHVIGDSASSIAEEAKGPKSTTSYSSALHSVIAG